MKRQSHRTIATHLLRDRPKAVQAGVPSRRFRGRILNRQTATLLRCPSQFGETTSPKTIGVIVFEQMTATDLAGPAEIFPRMN